MNRAEFTPAFGDPLGVTPEAKNYHATVVVKCPDCDEDHTAEFACFAVNGWVAYHQARDLMRKYVPNHTLVRADVVPVEGEIV